MNEKKVATVIAAGMATLATLSGINDITAYAISLVAYALLGVGGIAVAVALCEHYRNDRIHWYSVERIPCRRRDHIRSY
ncbi:hypothetical protein [Haloechinothrix salitolerans]|uniref:Uncharacterized protein n=1 Tax=Haloechinothrix salitolerans TaxID=926830 RepID=A0ABW2C2E0_9PSEU